MTTVDFLIQICLQRDNHVEESEAKHCKNEENNYVQFEISINSSLR